MQRKALGILGLLGLIIVAVVVGYWDMLNTEKLQIAENNAAAPARIAGDAMPDTGTSEPSGAAKPEAESASAAPDEAGTKLPSSADAGSTKVEGATFGNAAKQPGSEPAKVAAGEPSFDILRVEPSGETVVAGNAKPDTTVALIEDGKTIGEAKANADGQFALALEAPLAPGDHTIGLQATDGTGDATASKQTAIVSVPQDARSGQVLAMIDSPDAPGRIVEVPKAPEGQGSSDAETAGSDAPKDVPGLKDGGKAPNAVAEAGAGTERIAVGKTNRATVEADADAVPDVNADGSARDNYGQQTDAADGDGPSQEGDRLAMAAPDTVAPGAAVAGTPTSGTAERAGTAPHSDSPAAALRVEAVELQGAMISVAGAAKSGAKIRVYVDNGLVAEDDATADDRFLASGKADLSIGQHIVRADQLDAGGQVVARAEVPFDRPEGERVAAIAPPVGAAVPSAPPSTSPAIAGTASAASALTTPDARGSEAARGAGGGLPVAQGEGALAADPAGSASAGAGDGRSAAAEQLALAPNAGTATASPDAVASAAPAADDVAPSSQALPSRDIAAAQAAAPSEGPVGKAADATASPRPKSMVAEGEKSPRVAAAPPANPALSPSAGAQAEAATSGGNAAAGMSRGTGAGIGTSSDAAEGSPLEPAMDGPAGERTPPPVAVSRQAALTSVEGRVIIRRGDTLWRISRETYGLGRRYTVIYLANGEQIRDPNLIYPGQVFRLPDGDDKS